MKSILITVSYKILKHYLNKKITPKLSYSWNNQLIGFDLVKLKVIYNKLK